MDEEIIRLTVEQIKKDFGTYLPELTFSGNKVALFKELTEQISNALKVIRKNNTVAYRSLLYKVDIRESEVSKLESENAGRLPATPGSFFEVLAEKIIQREFQKVLTRKYYSRK